MENNNTNNELELLRQQMNVLKEKLDAQEIVNDRLVAKSMRKEMSWIKKYIYVQFALIPFVALIWVGVKYILGLSWWNYSFLMLVCVISVYVDYVINVKALSNADYHKNNLIETARKLVKMKRQRTIQMIVEILLLILWLIWTFLEVNSAQSTATGLRQSLLQGGIIGGYIGGVIGIIVAFVIFYKMQRTNDRMIEQIDDMMM
ncbi:MAG: hypothetical protein J6J71_00960 [Prevotella sp.]|nr:hypothetical protein [Prevotella sp.]